MTSFNLSIVVNRVAKGFKGRTHYLNVGWLRKTAVLGGGWLVADE